MVRGLWWCGLGLFAVIAMAAFVFSEKMSGLQERTLLRLGEEISADPERWEKVKIGDAGAFAWWRDVDLAHGLISQSTGIVELALAGLVVQLGVTLWFVKRKGRVKGREGGGG